MPKPIWLTLFLILSSGEFVFAQDMPPLPPMDQPTNVTVTDNTQGNSQAPPPLPSQPATGATSPAPSDNGSAPALPPLPAQSAAASSNDSSAAPPPLPAQAASPSNGTSSEPPPLPSQSAAPASESAPSTPPLPSDQTQQPSTVSAAPSTESAQTPGPEVSSKTASKHHHLLHPWQVSRFRPDVIFGGWVNAKGGNESARLAWVSQEVLNGLISKKYKSLKEEGRYEGQEGGYQWRQFTFKVPHSKLTVQVYARQVGKKVWLRVGPSEPPPPAVYSLSEVTKMRTEV